MTIAFTTIFFNYTSAPRCYIKNIGIPDENFIFCELIQHEKNLFFTEIGGLIYCVKSKKFIGVLLDLIKDKLAYYALIYIIFDERKIMLKSYLFFIAHFINEIQNYLLNYYLINLYKLICWRLFYISLFVNILLFKVNHSSFDEVLLNTISYAAAHSLFELNWRFNWYKAYKSNWCYDWCNYYLIERDLFKKNRVFFFESNYSLKLKWSIFWYSSSFKSRSLLLINLLFNKIKNKKFISFDAKFNLLIVYCLFFSLFKKKLVIKNYNIEIKNLKMIWFLSSYEVRALTIIYYIGAELKMCELEGLDVSVLKKYESKFSFCQYDQNFLYDLTNTEVFSDLKFNPYKL